MTKGSHLYVIYERVADVPESKVIEAMNDAVACAGFIQFLDNDKVSADEHKLVHIGELSDDKHVISSEYYVVCNGDKAKDVFETLKAELIQKNEEEI